MKKFSVIDWLTIQSQKELSFIRRSLEHETVNYAIFADLFIALFSFVMDHVLCTETVSNEMAIEQGATSWYWICTAILLVLVPVVIFYCSYKKKKKYQTDFQMVKPVEFLVDMFDNEICYNVMTADSMCDHLLDGEGGGEKEICNFYFIETSYYLNKAISKLFYFKVQAKNAIQINRLQAGGVLYTRFLNVCEIIRMIYSRLIELIKEKPEYKDLFSDNKYYIEMFNDLVSYLGGENGVTELSIMKGWIIKIPE